MMVYDVTIGNVQAEEESERKKRYFGIAHIFIAIAWGASSDVELYLARVAATEMPLLRVAWHCSKFGNARSFPANSRNCGELRIPKEPR